MNVAVAAKAAGALPSPKRRPAGRINFVNCIGPRGKEARVSLKFKKIHVNIYLPDGIWR
jgi:hypothetical protein